jgi:hypothetical protein
MKGLKMVEMDYKSFSGNWTYQELFKMISILDKLDARLRTILEDEIHAGNLISNVSENTFESVSIIVTLNKQFSKIHQLEGVEYSTPEDAQYWRMQYSCGKPEQLVVC